MSLICLPNELLREIVQYLRPYNEHEPIIGLNATWKPLSTFRASLKTRSRSISEEGYDLMSKSSREMIISYKSLTALRSTCSLMREICAPLLYENLNVLDPIIDFEDYYSSVLVPNAEYVRNIRILLDKVTTEEYVKCLGLCANATSLAIYSSSFMSTFATIEQTNPLCGSIAKMIKQGGLIALGIYSPLIIEKISLYLPSIRFDGLLLKQILGDPESTKWVKCLDLGCYGSLQGGPYDCIRTNFPSLETLAITHLLRSPAEDIWPLERTNYWAPYSNLKSLQFRGCKAVYSDRIPLIVRHFPSLVHILIPTCDDGEGGDVVKPKDWYDREEALWKVRKPLETLHLECVTDDEIAAMGEIPAKTLIVTNSQGRHLTGAIDGSKGDIRIFPGLQSIRIQPRLTQRHGKLVDPFDCGFLAALEGICMRRGITLRRDAEATSSWL